MMSSAQTYQAPAGSIRQLSMAHPEFDETIEALDKSGGNTAIQTWALEQAKAGNLLAQLYLAQQYLPEECTKPSAGTVHVGEDCDPTRLSGIGLKPSFEQMFVWLKKASAQGSGEATETLAQQMERQILDNAPGHGTEAEVKRLHALARSQGYDDEKLTIVCHAVGVSSAPLHRDGKPDGLDISDAEVAAARAVMPHGALGSYDSTWAHDDALWHPEGPYAMLRILMTKPLVHDVTIPMPLRTSVLAVQKGDGFTLIPADAPHNDRVVVLRMKDKDVVVEGMHADGSKYHWTCLNESDLHGTSTPQKAR